MGTTRVRFFRWRILRNRASDRRGAHRIHGNGEPIVRLYGQDLSTSVSLPNNDFLASTVLLICFDLNHFGVFGQSTDLGASIYLQIRNASQLDPACTSQPLARESQNK